MSFADSSSQTCIGTIDVDGVRYAVYCRVELDAVEFIGRLWFTDCATPDLGVPDRAAIPGRTRQDVLAFAHQLTPDELRRRQHRAFAERRQYFRLRHLTEEIIGKIRYLNHVAVASQHGILDDDSARHELELTERQLHACVDRLRASAGMTD